MEGGYDFDFDLGPYIFAFRPGIDDFNVVRIEQARAGGGTWNLSTSLPYVGEHCLECAGTEAAETDAWVFSRGFNFGVGVQYEALIHYRGGGNLFTAPRTMPTLAGERSVTNARLALWLCRQQAASSRLTRLIEVGVAHEGYQHMRVSFAVEDQGTYFFGGRAQIRPASAIVALGLNLAGRPEQLDPFV